VSDDALEVHQPCPDCGSSDALAIYENHTHCFSCGAHKFTDEPTEPKRRRKVAKDLTAAGEFRSLPKRKLHEETLKRFGYTVGEYNGKIVQIAPYHDADGALVAQKIRFPDKEFVMLGDAKAATLFGQRLWKDGGKRLVITEGEIDALSYAQATNLSWPVVSIPNGAQGAAKAIKKNLEFIEKFDEVVFLFDMDAPGREAANECADLLTPGKAKIAELPLKDANDMLVAGRVKELCQAVWNAATRRPDGIVNGSELWDAVSRPVVMGTPYPWQGLNRILFGLRPREIVTLSAGTGIGKSSVAAEIAYNIGQKIGQQVGYIALEEGTDRTGLRFMGLHANRPLHLPGNELPPAEMRRVFEETLGTGRYSFYDHFGSLDSDHLLSKLSYMVKGLGVKFLVLDHLSIVVSGLDPDEDERRAIDRTMTKLRSFTEETEASLILVSHLKRPDGKGHEDGAATSLSQLRGSAAIGQLSDAVIGLERNQQAEGEEKNDTILRVLKNRYAGITGIATALRWQPETGRLIEAEIEKDFAEDDGEPARDF
jgi:twinkle protein